MLSTTVVEQPIGQDRETVMTLASHVWRQESVCTIARTGYRMNKRAYFLVTCAFASQTRHTLCDETPTWIEYRCLEGTLIQVAYEFDTLEDPNAYQQCIYQQTLDMQATLHGPATRSVSIEEGYRANW